MIEKEFICIKEASQLLGVSEKTMKKILLNNEIHTTKLSGKVLINKNKLLSSIILISIGIYFTSCGGYFILISNIILTGIFLSMFIFHIIYNFTSISLSNLNNVWIILIIPFIIGGFFGFAQKYWNFSCNFVNK